MAEGRMRTFGWCIYRSKEPQILTNSTVHYTRALFKTMRLTAQPRTGQGGVADGGERIRARWRSKIGDAVIQAFTHMLEQISPKGRRQPALRVSLEGPRGRSRVSTISVRITDIDVSEWKEMQKRHGAAQ